MLKQLLALCVVLRVVYSIFIRGDQTAGSVGRGLPRDLEADGASAGASSSSSGSSGRCVSVEQPGYLDQGIFEDLRSLFSFALGVGLCTYFQGPEELENVVSGQQNNVGDSEVMDASEQRERPTSSSSSKTLKLYALAM